MANASARVAHLQSARQRLEPALDIARKYAGEVDRENRFPAEAFDALKRARLLGIMIPVQHGGEGATLAEIVDICGALGQACASAAMIFAMHQIKVSSLVTHGETSAWHTGFMQRVASEQLLLGSATTEGGIGGDLRNSICAIERDGDKFRLVKEANVISYGRQCDAILITSRRSPDAASSDQVMAVVTRDQYVLEKTIGWDTLGMRGTCSEGFRFAGVAPVAQIFPHAFAEIAAQSMLAMAHLMWGGVWFGIAADAVARAQAYLRAEARKKPGERPPGALRLSEAVSTLQEMKSVIVQGIAAYERAKLREDELSSVAFSITMNNVKIVTSQSAADIVRHVMQINGIYGYRNDSPYSVARHMRDALSAAIMINNDRILSNTSGLLLVSKFDTSLVA
jgi:acyl-CoA dehydrogenase